MKRYEKYKDSGVEWIGEIPARWERKKLKYVAKINPSKPSFQFDNTSDDKVVFLPMEKVSEGGKYNQELRKSINEVSSGFTCFEKGDVIVAKITPCFENGKGALLDDLETAFGYGSTEYHVLRANKSMSPKFLFYTTKTHLFMKTGEAFMSGSAGQKRVPSSFVENFLLGSPPPSEQTAIAAYLDEKTARIDKLIANKQRLIELLKEERTAIINHAVTKGINPKARLKPIGIEWLGDIPEHWEVKKLKYLTKTISKGTTPSTIGAEIVEKGLVRFLKAENILQSNIISEEPQNYIDEQTNNLLKRSELRENDVLIVIAGATIGKTAILKNEFIPANTNQAVCFIRLHEQSHSAWVWLYFQARYIKETISLEAVQSAQPNLSMEKIGNFIICMPPLNERIKIEKHIETSTQKIDAAISKIEKEIELMQEYRTALISEVVTGKIKVI